MKEILNVNAQAVLNVVRSLHNHPTALEVYEAVKQQRPRIGLASVYRILHTLVEQNYIRELALGDESSRYDAQTVRHDHALCRACGKLLDVPVEVAFSLQTLQDAAQTVGIILESHELRLYGLCTSCQATQEAKISY
ncbi:MAG TPA: transcriptional repressor [Ktedonobacteraceae bacterium]|nr:transcriptional repressor [Ktedonobacteraceae bacterium]